MNTKWMKTRLAAFLICALAAQNASFAWADTRGTADRAGRETDAAGGAAGQAAETALESGNTSFVSFPSRFSDMLPDGFEEQYYCFALEGTADISISVESDDSSCQYGAELLDSGFASLGLSQRKSGQRMIQRDLPAGTYFLRVFPLSENTWEPYSVSLQKLKLSAEEVRKTDFSELHMVAALQGDDSPYQMNGMNPDYGFTGDGSVSPVNYQWYRLESPVYSGRGVNGGGVYPMPQSYYSAWLGPVAEDVIPISEVKGYTEGSLEDYEKYLQEEAIAYREGTPLIHVQNAIALPMKYTGYYEDGEGIENPGWEAHIKAGIMNYGALTTGIYWSYLSGDEEKNYYYSGWDYTYVSDSDGNSVKVLKNMLDKVHYQNHEVVVVGWDDEYPRENFRYRIDRDTEGVVMDGPGQEATPSDMEKGASFEPFSGGRRRSAGRAATPSDLELSESEIATGSDMKAERDDEEGGIDKDEFLDSLLPERDGAWIIRNSWGTGAGEDGYYYVSYCDKQLFGADHTWAYAATETTGNYNKLYEITSLPYSNENWWITGEDYLLASTVFTADEDGADVLKAVNFSLLNNNIRYEIAVNQGEDIGKGWIEENVYAAGSKLYAGYYTVRLDKPVILEPGEPFEVILKMQGDGQEVLKIPLVTNGYMIANIPQRAGVCRLYDPEMGEWMDIGEGFVEDNGSNNYYGYFAVKAMCSDASLEDGEMERISALEIDPEVYYALLEDPGSEESPEEDVASPSDAAWDAWEMASAQESETATPSDAPAAGGAEEAEGGWILRDGHVLARRAAGMPLEMGELAEPDTVLPESFDLREEGVLTPVKDQASTNTCWSFGSTAAVESSYLLNGSNLYDFNYSSGISLETELPLTEEGRVIYRFDKNQPESLELAVFLPELLAWEDGPIEDAQGRLRWELSGDLSAVDTSDFEAETGGTGLTENGEAVCLFTPEESGILTVKVSSADDPTKTASCQVVLLEDNAVDRISVSPENLRLRAGQTHQLEVSIEAPEESQVNPIFSSDNPNIAAVDDSGLVLGVDSGTTVIRVRAGGEEAVCTVTVWKPGRSEGGDSDGGAGNSGKDRPVHGSWIQAADGSWNFSAGGSTYQNTWGYLYNPYGAAGAGEAGWFRFDAAGRLLTGWFQDEDGSWYYLNPISDGSLGKMATGWRWIPDASGREYCYYFHPNAGGPMGAMAASGKTPDGYEVDAQGRWCADGTPQTR